MPQQVHWFHVSHSANPNPRLRSSSLDHHRKQASGSFNLRIGSCRYQLHRMDESSVTCGHDGVEGDTEMAEGEEERRKSGRSHEHAGVDEEDEEPKAKSARIDAAADTDKPPEPLLVPLPPQQVIDAYLLENYLTPKLLFWEFLHTIDLAKMNLPIYLRLEDIDKLPPIVTNYVSSSKELSRNEAFYTFVKRKFEKDQLSHKNDKVCQLSKDLMFQRNPYIKGSDDIPDVLASVKKDYGKSYSEDEIELALSFCVTTLEIMEPMFHPVIRAAHLEFLLVLCDIRRKRRHYEGARVLDLSPVHFIEPKYDCPYPTNAGDADRLIQEKLLQCKHFEHATDQIRRLHEFGDYLPHSKAIKHSMSLEEAVRIAGTEFKKLDELDEGLMKTTLKDFLQVLNWLVDLRVYVDCWMQLAGDHKEKGRKSKKAGDIIKALNDKGFFAVDQCDTDVKKYSVHLVDAKEIFSNLPLSYVVQGLMDYKAILECDTDDEKRFGWVHGSALWKSRNLSLTYWRDIKVCDSVVHRLAREPLAVLKWNATSAAFEWSDARERVLKNFLLQWNLQHDHLFRELL